MTFAYGLHWPTIKRFLATFKPSSLSSMQVNGDHHFRKPKKNYKEILLNIKFIKWYAVIYSNFTFCTNAVINLDILGIYAYIKYAQ